MSGNNLVMKLSDGTTLCSYQGDQDYTQSRVTEISDDIIARKHVGKTLTGWACAEADVLDAAIALPKNLDTAFFVKQKQAVDPAETIIPPDGMTVNNLADTDECVCYTT